MKTSLIVFVLAIGGCCQTHYQSRGFKGGFTDQQIDSNTFRVSFRGNGFTSTDTVQTYLMRRCAEVTTNAGFDYFIIVSGSNGVSTSYTVNTQRNPYGSTGQVTPINKPRSEALIKVFKGSKPENDPNAYDARDVLAHIGGVSF